MVLCNNHDICINGMETLQNGVHTVGSWTMVITSVSAFYYLPTNNPLLLPTY
jgi:hypothetical protein